MAVTVDQLPVGTVVGQYMFVSQDSADAATSPDVIIVNGYVRFTCTAPILNAPSIGLRGVGVIPLTFDASFDHEGELIPLTTPASAYGIPGMLEKGIKLPASDSPLYTPRGFSWKVSFHLTVASTGARVQIPEFHINVLEGQTISLPQAMPVLKSGGVYITKGDKGETGATFASIRVEGDTLVATLEDGTELPPTPYAVPVSPYFGLDDAGNPYYDPEGVDAPIALMSDADGVPYFS